MSLTKEEVFVLSTQFLELMREIVPSSEIYCGLYKCCGDSSRHKLERKAKSFARAPDMSSSKASLMVYSGTHNSFKTEGTRATAIVHEKEYSKYIITALLLGVLLLCCLIIVRHSRQCSYRA